MSPQTAIGVARAQRAIDLFAAARLYRAAKDEAVRVARSTYGDTRKACARAARHANRALIATIGRAIEEMK